MRNRNIAPFIMFALGCSGDTINKYYLAPDGGPVGGAGGDSASSGSASTSDASAGTGGIDVGGHAEEGHGGSGGHAIDPPECVVPSDCPGVDSDCRSRTCHDGRCGVMLVASGQPTPTQVDGDCATIECNGAGLDSSVYDASDTEDDGNDCTIDECTSSGPTHAQIPGDSGSPTCNVRCVAYDRYPEIAGQAFRVCSNVILDTYSALGEVVGIDWTDDGGTPDYDRDDTQRMCGNLSELAHVGDTIANRVFNYGTCASGARCSIVHKAPFGSGFAYTGYHGLCE